MGLEAECEHCVFDGDAHCAMMKERAGDLTHVMQSLSCSAMSEGGVKCWGSTYPLYSVAGLSSRVASIAHGQVR
jgi:hypothetical protein